MKSNDKSLPLPVLPKSMLSGKGRLQKSGPSENIRRAGFVYQEDFFSLIPPEQSPALLLFHR